MHTVALYNHNGNLGSQILRALAPHHENGTIKLVVLHRPGSKLDSIPKSVETRVIEVDSPKGHEEANKKAVRGLNIVISAASIIGNNGQIPLIKALIGSPDIWAYVPSHYGPRYTATETIENPAMAFLFEREKLNIMARENGVPVGDIKAGLWLDLVLAKSYMMMELGNRSIDLAKNTMKAMDGYETSPMPLSTIAYIAEGIAQLVVKRPHELDNKAFDLIEFEPTGAEVAKLLTKVCGSEPTIQRYSPEDFKADLEADFVKKVFAIVSNKWATNTWYWVGERPLVEGWKGKSLEQFMVDAKAALDN